MEHRHVRWFSFVYRRESLSRPDRIPSWLVFLAYLAYLRAMKQRPSSESATLRTLIVVVGLVLVVVALVAAGAPEYVQDVLEHWPLLP